MSKATIAFIGGGNMARSLVGGLIADGVSAASLRVADVNAEPLERLHSQYGVTTFTDNNAAVQGAQVVLLAVKPQSARTAALELGATLERQRPLIISIVAGLRSADLARWLGYDAAIVRSMPNTPAMVQSGATALHANLVVNTTQRAQAESILRSVGLTLWLDNEDQMDAVTALSGSGPAYFFLIMELMQRAGTRLGLPPETARLLTLQTAFGAAKMALESPEDAATLRQRVTSPGGTTEQALKLFEARGLEQLFSDALAAAARRSQELADQLGRS
ncbi:MAG: pyrroline-5-carboxylate reductase [Gammaproteobacteria bacterium]|nr:pyrroline-5-carboxylate reductase [Gammaproteobacteria bacterium]